MEAAAEAPGVHRRIDHDVAAVDAAEHHERDRNRHNAEQTLQRRFGDKLRGDSAEQTARGSGDLERHPEAQIDQLIARPPRAD